MDSLIVIVFIRIFSSKLQTGPPCNVSLPSIVHCSNNGSAKHFILVFGSFSSLWYSSRCHSIFVQHKFLFIICLQCIINVFCLTTLFSFCGNLWNGQKCKDEGTTARGSGVFVVILVQFSCLSFNSARSLLDDVTERRGRNDPYLRAVCVINHRQKRKHLSSYTEGFLCFKIFSSEPRFRIQYPIVPLKFRCEHENCLCILWRSVPEFCIFPRKLVHFEITQVRIP